MVFFADYPFFEKLFSNLSIIVPIVERLRLREVETKNLSL